MRFSKPAFASFVGAVAVAAVAMGAFAADAAKERHDLMEGVRDAFLPLGGIMKKEAAFDAALVKKNATTIADNLKKASALFPEGSGGGASRAKAEIWTDAAGFAAAMKDAQAAAVALQGVADEAAFPAAFRALGTTCKSCHDKYRAPEK